MVQILHDLQLLLDDLVEGSAFDGKQAVPDYLHVFLPYDRLETHPKRNPWDDLQQDTAKTPDVDDPRIVVLLHVLQELRDVLELIFVEDEVQDLRGHVFWGGHWKLS